MAAREPRSRTRALGAAAREPPKSRFAGRHGRRRAGGRARHADEVRARPRSSTRCAAGRCWRTSSTRGRATADGGRARPADRRLLAAGRGDPTTSFADRAVFALQDEPRGTGDAVARRRSRRSPAEADEVLVLSGDVPLVTGADLEAVLEARRQDDAAIALASVFAADPAELGRVVRERVRHGRADRRGHATRRPRSWPTTRSTPASTPSTRPGCAAGSGRSTPSAATGELYLTELDPARARGRPPRERGRLRGRRPVRRDQRPLPARGGRVEHARPAQRGAHAQRRDDARPVDGLPRLDRRPRRGRHPRAERHPARRDDGR